MAAVLSALDRLPVATLMILIVALVGGVQLIVDGNLSADFEKYAAIVGGSSGLLGIGRGIRKQNTPVQH